MKMYWIVSFGKRQIMVSKNSKAKTPPFLQQHLVINQNEVHWKTYM